LIEHIACYSPLCLCRYQSTYNQYTGSTTLSIFNMRREDEGEYTCKAFNVAGETTTSAFLLHQGLSSSLVFTAFEP